MPRLDRWRNIAISNNVGGVKHCLSTLRPALGKERHFALVDGFAFQPKARSQSLRSGTQSDPTISSITTAIMITTSNSPGLGSGMPNHYVGDLRHTLAIFGLSHVRTELPHLLVIPLLPPTSRVEPRVSAPWLPWRSVSLVAWPVGPKESAIRLSVLHCFSYS